MTNFISMKCHLIALLSLSTLLFSCTKETFEQNSTTTTTHPTISTQTTAIDMDVLNTLRQDKLFQEYVWALDYASLNHILDSLEGVTENDEESYTLFQVALSKRIGTLKERFNEVKFLYPKDFFRYVFYENSLKTKTIRTKSIDNDNSDTRFPIEDCQMIANGYNKIISALYNAMQQGYSLVGSRIRNCTEKNCSSKDKLKNTLNACLLDQMTGSIGNALGGEAVYLHKRHGESYLTWLDLKIWLEECDRVMPGIVIDAEKISEDCSMIARLIISVRTWNGVFDIAFVEYMSCNEYGHFVSPPRN